MAAQYLSEFKPNQIVSGNTSVSLPVMRKILSHRMKSDDQCNIKHRLISQKWFSLITVDSLQLTLFHYNLNGESKWSFNEKYRNLIDLEELRLSSLITSNYVTTGESMNSAIKYINIKCGRLNLDGILEQLSSMISYPCIISRLSIEFTSETNDNNPNLQSLCVKDILPLFKLRSVFFYFHPINHTNEHISSLCNLINGQTNLELLRLAGINHNDISLLVENGTFNSFRYSLKKLHLNIYYDGTITNEKDQIFEQIIIQLPHLEELGFDFHYDIHNGPIFNITASCLWIPKLTSIEKWKYLNNLWLLFDCSCQQIQEHIYDMKRMNGNILSLKQLTLNMWLTAANSVEYSKTIIDIVTLFSIAAPNVIDFSLNVARIPFLAKFVRDLYSNSFCHKLTRNLKILSFKIPYLGNLAERSIYLDSLGHLFQYCKNIKKLNIWLESRLMKGNQFEIIYMLPRSVDKFRLCNHTLHEMACLFQFNESININLNYLDKLVQRMNDTYNLKTRYKFKINAQVLPFSSRKLHENKYRIIFYYIKGLLVKYNCTCQMIDLTKNVKMKFNWSFDDIHERILKFDIQFA